MSDHDQCIVCGIAIDRTPPRIELCRKCVDKGKVERKEPIYINVVVSKEQFMKMFGLDPARTKFDAFFVAGDSLHLAFKVEK